MREVMYDHNSILIVALLLSALVIAIEIGFRIGRRFSASTNEATRSQINSIQASILGLLALLLGFTFSLALQRYDTRSQAVVNEANAIGTGILRANLIPAAVRTETQDLLHEYVRLRVRAGVISLDRANERDAVLAESDAALDRLWGLALQAAELSPNPVTSGLYVQSLNELIDAYGVRDAALSRHVPEAVLFLLFGTLVLTAGLVGFSSGVTGYRTSFAVYALLLLIICLVFIVIDLDRPRRGFIEVSQQSLVELGDKLADARDGPS